MQRRLRRAWHGRAAGDEDAVPRLQAGQRRRVGGLNGRGWAEGRRV
ncbi:hypothetical protein U9M48_042677 [Paspalum notatum var. saurae]|uniref:Uncharacterized protein n=1 Tax=Paspalum notatum var. saurae TaxID=547442 RepID=A0AAQ3XGD5_PASNO